MKRLTPMDDRPMFMDEDEPQEQPSAVPFTVRPLDCPAPGVYPNVPFETYVRWNALNHSTLRKLDASPAHFRFALDNPQDVQTASKEFGTGLHELLLEPSRFMSRVVPAPLHERKNKETGEVTIAPYGRTTKAWAEYASKNPGKLILGEDEIERMKAMIGRLVEHPEIGPLLSIPGASEVCLVWDCPITGLRCKARIDRMPKGRGRIDVKTTRCAAAPVWRGSMMKFAYNTQDVFYELGVETLRAAGLIDCNDESQFVVIETAAPHEPALYTIGEKTRSESRSIVREWLCAVRDCLKSGVWPGYSRGPDVIDAPGYWFAARSNDE